MPTFQSHVYCEFGSRNVLEKGNSGLSSNFASKTQELEHNLLLWNIIRLLLNVWLQSEIGLFLKIFHFLPN
jgi:hypothetical protein